MSKEVFERIEAMTDYLAEQASEAEQLGRLPDETAKRLRECGVVRMLQPKKYGGYQAHPVEFFKAVMAVAERDPSAGWIAGVVGVLWTQKSFQAYVHQLHASPLAPEDGIGELPHQFLDFRLAQFVGRLPALGHRQG